MLSRQRGVQAPGRAAGERLVGCGSPGARAGGMRPLEVSSTNHPADGAASGFRHFPPQGGFVLGIQTQEGTAVKERQDPSGPAPRALSRRRGAQLPSLTGLPTPRNRPSILRQSCRPSPSVRAYSAREQSHITPPHGSPGRCGVEPLAQPTSPVWHRLAHTLGVACRCGAGPAVAWRGGGRLGC